MSLKEQWYAAKQQRQQEIIERKQQVLEERHQTAQLLSNITLDRLHNSTDLRERLSNFHGKLQADVATFLQETRLHQQQTWLEGRYERAAYVAFMRDYVWGTAAPFSHGSSPMGISFSPISVTFPTDDIKGS